MKLFAALLSAVLAWSQAPARAPEPPEAMTLARRAYELARAGHAEEAAASLREAARLAPDNALYRSALGGIYERQGKLEEAVSAFFEAVRLDGANARLREHLESVSLDYGAALARERRYRAGLALARQTVAQFSQSSSVYLMLGLFETRNQENLAAVSAYRRALELNPESAEASAGLGMAQSSAGLMKDAEATFQAGLKRFPQDAMHRQAYGVLLVKLAETGSANRSRAVEMLESALKMDPSLAEAHYQLGSLALADDDAATAAREFALAAANGLDDSRLHYGFARALRRLGRAQEAERRLELFRERKKAEAGSLEP
ncbi:MAG: tetratricopeptide repeat protein [Bryobacterales bacterium]|nr:tetratricopeptide repeat protein [Bryobacterales bacterium]